MHNMSFKMQNSHSKTYWNTYFIRCDWSELKVNRSRLVARRRYRTWRRWFWQLKCSCPRLQHITAQKYCWL